MEDLEEILGVPASLLPLAFETDALGLLLLQETEDNVAEHGEVPGGIAGPDATLNLTEADIKDPMHAVLNAPITAHRRQEAPSREGTPEQI